MNMIVIDSQQATKDIETKFIKDDIKNNLKDFLDSLSEEEIERFKSADDLKQMIINLAVIKSEENKVIELRDINSIDAHIIESMFKRYIDNA